MALVVAYLNAHPSFSCRSQNSDGVEWHVMYPAFPDTSRFVTGYTDGGNCWVLYGQQSDLDAITASAVRTWPNLSALRADTSTAEAIAIATAWADRKLANVILGREDETGEPPQNQQSNGLSDRTNLEAPAWEKQNVTVTANGAADPLGAMLADVLTESNASGAHSVSQAINGTIPLGTAYASILAKKAAGSSRDWLRIAILNQSCFAWFNFGTGEVGSQVNCTGAAEDMGSGWWRFVVTYSHDPGASPVFDAMITDTNWGGTITGNGTASVYLYDASVTGA